MNCQHFKTPMLGLCPHCHYRNKGPAEIVKHNGKPTSKERHEWKTKTLGGKVRAKINKEKSHGTHNQAS